MHGSMAYSPIRRSIDYSRTDGLGFARLHVKKARNGSCLVGLAEKLLELSQGH
jgi:hypothetical protein